MAPDSEESAQPDAIGHKSACPLGHWRFVTYFDLKTPGGRGISVILGVYIKALCRHPQRPVRAEGVPLHDAEGRAHNGVYVKAFPPWTAEGGHRLPPVSVRPFRRPGAAACRYAVPSALGRVDLRRARRWRGLSAERGRERSWCGGRWKGFILLLKSFAKHFQFASLCQDESRSAQCEFKRSS